MKSFCWDAEPSQVKAQFGSAALRSVRVSFVSRLATGSAEWLGRRNSVDNHTATRAKERRRLTAAGRVEPSDRSMGAGQEVALCPVSTAAISKPCLGALGGEWLRRLLRCGHRSGELGPVLGCLPWKAGPSIGQKSRASGFARCLCVRQEAARVCGQSKSRMLYVGDWIKQQPTRENELARFSVLGPQHRRRVEPLTRPHSRRGEAKHKNCNATPRTQCEPVRSRWIGCCPFGA